MNLAPDLFASLATNGFAIIDPSVSINPEEALIALSRYLDGSPMKHDRADKTLTGYFPYDSERAVGSPTPDGKEFYHARAPADLPADLRPTFGPILKYSMALANAVADVLGLRSRGLDHDYERDSCGMLRLIRYREGGGAALHTDITLFTLLLCESNPAVVFVDRSGAESELQIPEGQIGIMAGDMLEILTSGAIRACSHRARVSGVRSSVVFFANPPDTSMLTPKLSAGEALRQRLREMNE